LEASIKTIERLKEIGVHIWKKKFTQSDMNKLLLILASVAICVGFSIPFLDIVAVPVLGAEFSFGVVGYILTGLLISRGSNTLHNFIEKVKQWQQSTTKGGE
jgi:hypothetical protein